MMSLPLRPSLSDSGVYAKAQKLRPVLNSKTGVKIRLETPRLAQRHNKVHTVLTYS
jgi:hypothetical protein